jgi:hypothetical protein
MKPKFLSLQKKKKSQASEPDFETARLIEISPEKPEKVKYS